MDLSLNSSGASQVPFAGQALVTTDASAGCEGGGYYAIIKQYNENANWYDNLIGLAVEGSDSITLVAGSTKRINVYGVFSNGSSKLIDASKLAYTATSGAGSMSGSVLTAASDAGSGTVTVVVAGTPNPKPSISAVVNVTVTAE
jgi:hypothetical protein